MEPKEREASVLILADGRAPFSTWFASIKDIRASAAIRARIARARAGNFGDHRLFRGIIEMRIDYGPGYRVYCGLHRDRLIILIGGGTKKAQQADIERAVALWEAYRDETT